MSADAAPLHRFGRIDERLLWPGTGPRFILLMVLFVTSSATVASTITHSLTDPHNMSGAAPWPPGPTRRATF